MKVLVVQCGKAMIGRNAKSHKYYYYTYNRSFKQGSEACGAKSLPKEKLEKVVIDQISIKILNDKALTELVMRVNDEVDSRHSIYGEKLEALDLELKEIELRLTKLYDALETGKLSLNDLAPRIKELKQRQDGSSKARILLETEMELRGVRHLDTETIKLYANDIRSLLTEMDITISKSSLRTFVEKIVIDGSNCTVYYKLPVPPQWPKHEEIQVLPTEYPKWS
ncbi:zinc ribbon domain-containing protein [Chloroflexota bacterium]